MVESRARKAAFLREVSRQLKLTHTYVENVRSEELASRPEFAAAADVLTIRAVKVDAALLRDIDRFLRPGGAALLFQSNAASPGSLAPLVTGQGIPLVPSLGSRLLVLTKPNVG
jgi:16S rRNA G527 N7-methylase RsmG